MTDGKITYKVVADTAQYSQDIKQVEEETTESYGKLQAVGKATFAAIGAAAAASGAAFVNTIKNSLDAVGDREQLIGGVETLFKESADVVSAYAENAYKTAGVSANTYMETVTSFSASLLQGLGGDTAEAAEIAHMAIVDMSDNANKMGSDIASLQMTYGGFAKQNYTMLDNLNILGAPTV